jgi:hypothetical protein
MGGKTDNFCMLAWWGKHERDVSCTCVDAVHRDLSTQVCASHSWCGKLTALSRALEECESILFLQETGSVGAGGNTGRGARVRSASICWTGLASGAGEGLHLCEQVCQ